MFDLDFILKALSILVPVLLVIIIITQGYVKAPPDHAYIISGLRKQPRVLIGRAGIKIPFFEQMDKLYLGQITVDIKTHEYIPTNDFINVMVDAVAALAIPKSVTFTTPSVPTRIFWGLISLCTMCALCA